MTLENVFIGKDILRLLTKAMYDEPLTTYREYIQNSVDAFDSVSSDSRCENAKIVISHDLFNRSITILDTGPGIPNKKFHSLMTSIGWSEKTHAPLRGMWGTGRLVGLAYCRNLVFRTKHRQEGVINKIIWDGQQLMQILSDHNESELSATIEAITNISSEVVDVDEPSFFEVQLNGVVRHGNDVLFNDNAVRDYISQVAPVPFDKQTPFHIRIKEFLSPYVDISGYEIFLNDDGCPISRPYRKKFNCSMTLQDEFTDVEFFKVESNSVQPIAVGWLLHHSYLGAIKATPSIRGFRMRMGNIQIGDERVLASIFPEERFNSWTVGEVHIIDKRIRPNGKRNGLEESAHVRDVRSRLVSMVGRHVARKCRENSSIRHQARVTVGQLKDFEANLSAIQTGLMSEGMSENVLDRIERELINIEARLSGCSSDTTSDILVQRDNLIQQLRNVKISGREKSQKLSKLPKTHQRLVNYIADLIFENAETHIAAKELLVKLQSSISS